MAKKFQRNIEDFTCKYCKALVIGDGYTNHCPRCLWSKHVDINPGDREHPCGELMEPIAIEPKDSDYVITHRCTVCGEIKRNKSAVNDDFEDILKISSKIQP